MRYILLNPGEVVKDGDEEYSTDESSLLESELCWHPVDTEFIGANVQEVDPPVRRRIKLSKIPTKG